MHNQKKCPFKWCFLYIFAGVLCLSRGLNAAQAERDGSQVIVQFKPGADDAKVKEKAHKQGPRSRSIFTGKAAQTVRAP